MSTPPREIEGTWEEVAAHAAELAGRRVRITVLGAEPAETRLRGDAPRVPAARALLMMPPAERSRILRAQAAKAEAVYRSNPDLMGFEAFGDADLYDETLLLSEPVVTG